MDTKRLIGIFSAMLMLCLLPLVVFYPEGTARAGLSHGFLTLPQNPFHLTMVMVVGFWASTIRRDAVVLLPLCFILLFLLGSLGTIETSAYPDIHTFILGTTLIFAFAVSLMPTRNFYTAVAVSGSLAYHLGVHSMQNLPATADHLFFIIGVVLSLALILAASVALSTAIRGVLPSATRHNREEKHVATPMKGRFS